MENHFLSDPFFKTKTFNQKQGSNPVSLIISFYNNTELLKMIFAALKKQSFSNFEVVIADDGSSETSVNQVHNLAENATFPVKHCWHEDKGWRKNIILNEAIRQSEGTYLLFIDGDCIPHHCFIEEHFQARIEGKVITGRRVQLTEKMTRNLKVAQIKNGDIERFWIKMLFLALFSKVKHPENAIRIKKQCLRKIFVKDKENGILGCNFSIFKSDILKVNGFDERFLHPGTGEDTDLNSRLLRAGVGTISKKHLLTMFHIYHKKFDLAHQPNIDLWNENNKNQVTYTPYGIFK